LEGEALSQAIAALGTRIDAFCAHQPTYEPNRRLVKHVNNERRHLLTFLTTPGVAATNWEAEQALRGMICNRKHWGGNKTRQGADTAAVLASVLRTAAQQDTDPIAVLAEIQRTGMIPAGLVLTGTGRSP
jgi:Transposase IS66 family